ncbi:hypothetical protein GCM10023329_47590 [Streptomyces sanyensis]|uniref:Uncharacterized protein n=1 Tax=Streptomyces sanyensis TaxID=568869 RepID=A0ABP9B4Q6_9ACTN
MWQTPQAWIRTTASPGPGSGTMIASTRTGSSLPGAITPFTCCGILGPALPLTVVSPPTMARRPVPRGPYARGRAAGAHGAAAPHPPRTAGRGAAG